MIQTGDPILDRQVNQPISQDIGIFLKANDLPPVAQNGDRAVVIETHSSRCFTDKRSDLGYFVIPVRTDMVPGKDGKDGKDGIDGKDGVDGTNGEKGEKGDSIVGEKGEKGDVGEKGEAGKDGKDGVDGTNGEVGQSGKDGKDGIDGKDGEKGEKGDKGETGKDGVDAKEVDVATLPKLLVPMLKQDTEFLALVKGEKGEPGRDGMNGSSPRPVVDRLFVGFSADGQNWHTPSEDGDKYVSFEVNDSGKNIIKITS